MPIIRVRKGDRVRATLVNGLPEHTSVHWHGLRVPNAVDGVRSSRRNLHPGEWLIYEFETADAGTFFFIPIATRWSNSAAGSPASSSSRATPTSSQFDADLVLVVKDFRVDGQGRFLPLLTDEGASRTGTFGTLRTVNGRPNPTLEVPAGGDVRLRLLNVDNTRGHGDRHRGAEAALVAVDGNALDPAPLRSWWLGPAMRVDLAVRAPKAAGACASSTTSARNRRARPAGGRRETLRRPGRAMAARAEPPARA